MTTYQDDNYYTASRVYALCRLYQSLLDSRPPSDPELDGAIKRSGMRTAAWFEESACKRADIDKALDHLERLSPAHAFAVRHCLINRHAQRDAIPTLQRMMREPVYQRRVSRMLQAATKEMARYLSNQVAQSV